MATMIHAVNTTTLATAMEAWSRLLGTDQLLNAEQAQQRYGRDTGANQRRLLAALRVTSAEHLQEVVRIACQHGIPFHPISTGNNWGYGSALPVKDDCVLLDLGGMQRIVHFDADLGVVTLEPGVTQAMLARFLDDNGHEFLVPVTGAGPNCSILSNALERGYGVTPYTDHFSAVTDLQAVLPDGSLYRSALHEAGGEELARLFKWGIGPYTNGLFTQSGMGIVTRITIALARKPACVKACLFSLKHDDLLEPAVLAIRTILGRLQGTIGGINLMNQHRVLSMTAPYPADQLGADGLMPPELIKQLGKRYQVFPWTGLITLYGTAGMVAAAQVEIKRVLGPLATRMMFLTPQRARQLAFLTRLIPGRIGKNLQSATGTLAQSLELVAGRPNETALPLAYWRNSQAHDPKRPSDPARDGCGLIWYAPLVPMRPTDVRAYVNMVHQVAPRHGAEPLITLTSLGDRVFDSTVPILFDQSQAGAAEKAHQCYGELLHEGHTHGWFPYRMGIQGMERLTGAQDHALNFHRRLQAAIDPKDLLSPGRYR